MRLKDIDIYQIQLSAQVYSPHTTVSSVTGFVQVCGHWQDAVTPSKDGAQVEYLGQVSFEHGSREPGTNRKKTSKYVQKIRHIILAVEGYVCLLISSECTALLPNDAIFDYQCYDSVVQRIHIPKKVRRTQKLSHSRS